MGLKNPYSFLFSKFVDKKTEDKRQKDKVCYRYLVSLIRNPPKWACAIKHHPLCLG